LISQLDHLNPTQQTQVLALIAAASDHDGVPPVSEHVLLHLRHGGDKADTHFIAENNGVVVGYAHLDLTDQVEGPSAELVVGIGQSLLAAVQERAGSKLRLWSHGDLMGAKNIAEKSGFSRARTVIQMRRSLNDPIPELSKEVTIRNFLPSIDNEEWIALNNRAFARHPEQGNWTTRDLDVRTKEEWFDPQGFLISEENGEMTGFCWTKIHGGLS